MTNQEFRSNIAKEMRDKYDERNKRLEQAEKSFFTDGLKEQMKTEIMDNFNQGMNEMKSRPWYEEAKKTHLEEIKAKIKLAKSKKEYEDSLKAYEDAQIAHRWEVEQKITKNFENKEKSEIPQKLKDSRKKWEENINLDQDRKAYEDAQIVHRWEVEQKITKNSDNKENSEIPESLLDFRKKWEEYIDLDEDTKKKIIDVVNEIQKWAKEESDWSILVEFELWWKGYKTLDVNVAEHSDNGYLTSYEYDQDEIKNQVIIWWMMWDNTKDRENRVLADYVDKQRDTREMEIKTIEFQRDLINKLWAKAGLTKMSDKIAMWMYLTWNYGYYWLSMWNSVQSDPKASSRSRMACFEFSDSRNFTYGNDINVASLCLTACH